MNISLLQSFERYVPHKLPDASTHQPTIGVNNASQTSCYTVGQECVESLVVLEHHDASAGDTCPERGNL